MSANLNRIDLIGNLGHPPEFKHKEGQTPFCVFQLAVDRPKREGGNHEPLWFRVTLWGRQAEVAVQFGHKGMQVYVEGRLDVFEWTDNDARSHYRLEVDGSDFQMLGDSLFAQSERIESEAQRLQAS